MPKPLFSVVVPTYNEEKYINPCLDSLVQQDFPKDKYEIIVVDSSTDKTPEIVKKYFPKVRLVTEKRPGIVFARIKGAEEAKGEIVAYLDADSLAPVNWLGNLEKCYQDSQVVAVGGTVDFQPKTLVVKIIQAYCDFNYFILKMIPGQNLSFRKSVYQKIGGFAPHINIGEDAYIAQALRKAGKVIILKDNRVISSSRRVLDGDIIFGLKSLVNMYSVFFFQKPVIFRAKPIRDKAFLKKPNA